VKKLWLTILIPSAVVLGCLSLLSFGNPQWNKYFYMWQCYIYPNHEDSSWETSEYTGIWKSWTDKGELWLEQEMTNGFTFHSIWYSEKDVVAQESFSCKFYLRL